jgi:hypothetical protein
LATVITTPTTDFHCLDICHARHTKKARIHSGLIYYVKCEIISELEEGAKLISIDANLLKTSFRSQ